jgi:hypothetical protein
MLKQKETSAKQAIRPLGRTRQSATNVVTWWGTLADGPQSDDLPGNQRQTSSFFVDERAAGGQDVALVQREEGQSGRGGRVLVAGAVRVLQRTELVLAQHFPHDETPAKTREALTAAWTTADPEALTWRTGRRRKRIFPF